MNKQHEIPSNDGTGLLLLIHGIWVKDGLTSLIVLSSILSSWISGSGDGSEDMLITGGDSSGTLSVVGSDDDGAP